MRHGIRLTALLLALACALCACGGGGASQDGTDAALPSPPLQLERDIQGDTSAEIERDVTLYRAADGTLELTSVSRSIRAGADGNLLRSVLEELLGASPTGETLLVSGARATLEDVEFGSGVATVRLSIDAAVNRGDQDYLLLCASIANTLLGIDGVEAVNVLTGSRSISVCGLPTGAFAEAVGSASAAYAQAQSERERFLEEGVATLERNACLYFPAYGDQYLLPEVRTLTFSGGDYASELIRALCDGPRERSCCVSATPANIDLLDGAPLLSVTADGERLLELKLSSVLANYLVLAGVQNWQLYGSLVLTLTSFLPELDAVRVSVGGEYVTECELPSQLAVFPDGRMRRSDFSQLIGGSAQLYFRENNVLARAECAVSQAGAMSASSILSAMITVGAYRPGLQSVFPAGIVPEDVLGVEIEDRTAIVNLSGNFYSLCQSMDAQSERLLIYAMVDALTELDAIGAVGFLVEGRQIDSLVGSVYLRSTLMRDPGLVHEYSETPVP